MAIIDVTNPVAPLLVGSLSLPGTAKGVDVDLTRELVVVAAGTNGMHVVSISDRAAPVLLGTAAGADVRDIVVAGNFTFLADYFRSFTVADITNPASPVVGASTPSNTGGLLQDIGLSGTFAVGADMLFVNGVPIIDVSNPRSPQPRAILNFSNFRDDNGTGIAADTSFAYLTAERSSGISENGVFGDTRLYIGQYRAQEDIGGVAPTVLITSPIDGDTVIQGENLTLFAQASDDIAVASVTFEVNGIDVFTDNTQPFETPYLVPDNASNLTIIATAIDLGNNAASSNPVQVNAIPDPLTTVIGRIVNEVGEPVSDASVLCRSSSGNSDSAGRFSIAGIGTVSGPIGCSATAVDATGQTLSGSSMRVAPVRAGETDVGDLVISPAHFETNLGVNLNQGDDTSTYVAFSNEFSFPLYDITYAGVHVNSNGRLTFNFGDSTFNENLTDFNEQPQVAAFFDDLYPPIGEGVYVRQDTDRLVVTWNRLTHYPGFGTYTIQVVLFRDGRIQIGYNGIDPTNTGTIVGISPGNGLSTNETDFSASAPLSVSPQLGVYEWFTGDGDPFDLDTRFLIFTPDVSGEYQVDIRSLQ